MQSIYDKIIPIQQYKYECWYELQEDYGTHSIKNIKIWNKSAIWAIAAFAIFSAFCSWIITFAVFFLTSCFLTVTTLYTRILVAKRNKRFIHYLVDCQCSNLTMLLAVVTASAVTPITKHSYYQISMYLEQNINSIVLDILISCSYTWWLVLG